MWGDTLMISIYIGWADFYRSKFLISVLLGGLGKTGFFRGGGG